MQRMWGKVHRNASAGQVRFDLGNIKDCIAKAEKDALKYWNRDPPVGFVYRLQDQDNNSFGESIGHHIELAAYPITRKTRCGYYVFDRFSGYEKFQYTGSPRSKYGTTIKATIDEFVRRKRSQRRIAQHNLSTAESALTLIGESFKYDDDYRPIPNPRKMILNGSNP